MSRYRNDKYKQKDIGIGYVASTIGWIQAGKEKKGASVDEVVEHLMQGYFVDSYSALATIDMAKLCGIVEEEKEILYIKGRDGKKH